MKKANDLLKENLKENDVVVLGISGGPDSMALLHLLIEYRKKMNIFLVCAHVDHNVRNESADELLFVENYCNKHNVKFESMVINDYGDDNFENEARNIRYNFFDEIISKYNANFLMTAHHGDDLMETILMRIVRGSTLTGYSGFSYKIEKDNYVLLRPLIFNTKEEILKYNERNDIPYVIDKTNFMDIHTRNRYRKSVLPFLKEEDKNVHLKFLKYSKTLMLYADYIDKQARTIMNDIYKNGKLNIDEFKKCDEVIQNRIVYQLFENFYQDDLVLISDVHVNLIKNLIFSDKSNSRVYLPNSVIASKSYNDFSILKETSLIDKYEIELSDVVFLPNGKYIEKIDTSDSNSNFYCRLSYDDITLPLFVRTKKLGDKMYVKGLNGSKKLKDVFIDEKISIKDRQLWPVVVDAKGKIVWIPGLKKSKFDVPMDKKCDIILKYY